MNDPHAILGVPRNSDEATVRQRYLELVRQHPPDTSPARFAEIREAYDELRDPIAHLRAEIFRFRAKESFDDIIGELRERSRGARFSVETLLSLGNG